MANPEHRAKLMEGREAWNAWRDEERISPPDLREAVLEGLDLSGFNLSYLNLDGANLTGYLIENAVITGMHAKHTNWANGLFRRVAFQGLSAESCDFGGAALLWTTFMDCDLVGGSFRDAELYTVLFAQCRLNGADFSRAEIEASFASCELRDVRGMELRSSHLYASVGIDTFFSSGGLSEELLRESNVPEEFVTYARSLAGRAIEYYSCFISYSSKDDEFTHRLHADLQARKIKTWFAPDDMKTGDRLRDVIDESIRIHDKLVLILPPLHRLRVGTPRSRSRARSRRPREERHPLPHPPRRHDLRQHRIVGSRDQAQPAHRRLPQLEVAR